METVKSLVDSGNPLLVDMMRGCAAALELDPQTLLPNEARRARLGASAVQGTDVELVADTPLQLAS